MEVDTNRTIQNSEVKLLMIKVIIKMSFSDPEEHFKGERWFNHVSLTTLIHMFVFPPGISTEKESLFSTVVFQLHPVGLGIL